MLSKSITLTATTALAPIVWGTTYIVAAELLPPDRPLLAALLRSLPAGLLLLLLVRRLPRGSWWWRSAVLGVLNIGLFFALLFVAAYRLPGGVAATVGAVQPLLVALFASRWIGERLTGRKLAAGVAGLAGVGLLVLQAQARLDALGVAAALGGAVAMAAGVVLTKKWGTPDTLLAATSWQLVAGGLFLLPVALLVEGPPPALTGVNLAGYAYLGVTGTALAYYLWFRGLHRLPASSTALLGLLSPVVAAAAGWLLAGQVLSPGQCLGAAMVLATLVLAGPAGHRRANAAAVRTHDVLDRSASPR
ncbi:MULTISPECIES: EamA family transporter [unclassified Arthrobacter]|uniref:EamA family transporter n=1 Tax=unclassified Arthrobacter TaxID=235627 RepID=UPI001D154309|nr:EamA family transporter [Arthrobacter sp. zg-Y1110]MCC3289844.1 EamA family transporter [Arthrobacter sp. zg-Y1110]MCC3300653.1 EamA family transporter [Arthrobacter sp. zg-Y895]UWX84741.1 EamA family transporter [Arthrobacter sp. zg-Y1110]